MTTEPAHRMPGRKETMDNTFETQVARYLAQFRRGLLTHDEFVAAVARAVAEAAR